MGITTQAKTSLVSTKQAAELCGVAIGTINRWVREGRLEPAVEGTGTTGTRFYFLADIEALS